MNMCNLTGREIWFFRGGSFHQFPCDGELVEQDGFKVVFKNQTVPAFDGRLQWKENVIYLVNYEVKRKLQNQNFTFCVPWNEIDENVYTSINYGNPE